MRVTCPQPLLLSAVQKLHRVITTNSPLPALTGILIKAHDKRLSFHATDLEMGILLDMEADIEEEGELLLPARLLTDIVRHLPPVNVHIDGVAGGVVTLSYQQSRVELYSLDPGQFPALPDAQGTASFRVPAETFKEAIKKVGIAAGNEDLRSIYHGILWEIDPSTGEFTMVATDTHRLSLQRGKVVVLEGKQEAAPIIPHRTLAELARLLGSEGEVTFTLGSSQIFAAAENLVFYGRLLNGQFPPYRQVLPSSFATEAIMDAQEITLAVERALVLARDDSRLRSPIIRLQVEGGLKLSTQAPEVGQIEEELQAEISGPGLEVALNGKYLLSALKVIDEDRVILKFNEPLKPVVVQGLGNEDYFCLILPVRIG
ncbi:MAG: DNA polymerase III subunit beta [Thermanaeromonas sp.]|uniref:DNA polymerase III subunit beta n=1 Tax=Thermanaeromonas sp. TaxID=2003697 RepID=UPI002439B41D|nr:DNA polymerase III subunit beta [Thermanaeromonas sp.]MCG0277072.1 DNA polymerase III subunit beta [Thermanaeromonas sp.]